MKQLINILFLITFIISNAQFTYIPDDNFEQALIDLGYDDVIDDYVLTQNITNITYLAVNNKEIDNLIGLEDFLSLNYLNCEDNSIFSIDISHNISLQNFYCNNNNLSNIDTDNNINLKIFSCSINPITSLNLSNNPSLENVYCINTNVEFIDMRNENNQLITLFNAINNPNLSCIYVDDSNASFLSEWWVDENTHFVDTEQECIDLSVLDYKKQVFSIYPNPVNEVISFTHNDIIKCVSIFNIQRKILKEFRKQDSYNVNSLKNGIYYIKISTNNHTEFMKFIKN